MLFQTGFRTLCGVAFASSIFCAAPERAAADQEGMAMTPASSAMGMRMDTMLPGGQRFSLTGWVEAGFTANFASPDDHQNFGRLLDDRANEPLLNQLVVNAQRYLDPKEAGNFDWGFDVQLFYGSDARYLHSTGLLDLATDDIVQPDVPEAWILAHFPISGTAGGLDLKLGKFLDCFGAEMPDPRGNLFYSHSYIFNFGCPFYGTGALFTLHALPGLEISASVDRGLNVAVENNNDSPSFSAAVSGKAGNGKVTYALATHFGPEDPHDNHDYRYLSDATLSWKATDQLTLTTDLNYVYEESVRARGYGIAQYLDYALTPWLSANLRGEVWRDEKGFFVAQFASPNDFIHFARGDDTVFDPRTIGGGNTTYGELTAGLTFRPPVPKPLAGLIIRPELRYDRSLNGTRPFNDSADRGVFTAGVDVVVSF